MLHTMITRHHLTLLACLACLLLPACGEDTTSGDEDNNNSSQNNTQNNNNPANNSPINNNPINNNPANNNPANNNPAPQEDAGADDAALPPDDAALPPEDATLPPEDAEAPPDAAVEDASPQGATLRGTIIRGVEPSTNPAGDARGDIYVAVLTADPIFDRANAQLVGQALLEDVDLAPQGASVTYTISNIPPRAQPYWVATFLDDNGNATVDDPAPDRGDLLQLNGISIPQVTINAAEVTWDVTLNSVLPF